MNDYETRDLTRYVAGTIRGLMAKHGVSQSEMAAAVGVSQSQLSKMTRGAKPITIDQLHAMCYALGEDVSVVLKQAEDFLADYDYAIPARVVYVMEGMRRAKPWVVEGADHKPLLKVVEGRRRSPSQNVGPLGDTEESETPAEHGQYGLAAHPATEETGEEEHD